MSTTTPITKIWLFTLKSPSNSPTTNGPFRTLLESVLAFCHNASGPVHSGHYFYADTSTPSRLVMITGYPSVECNLAADKEYFEQGYMGTVFEYVDHEVLMQIEMSVTELPVEGEGVVLGIGGEGKGEKSVVVKKGREIEAGEHTKEVVLTFVGDGQGDVTKVLQGAKVMHLKKILS